MTESLENHHYWMKEALKAAERALPQDVPVGAVLLLGKDPIAFAHNRREQDRNPVGHAEILALLEAAQRLERWRLNETTLYVTLEPCPMCASAIVQARIRHVVFGAYDPLLGACGSRYDLLMDSPDVSVLGGVLEAECSTLLKTFFHARRTP